MLAPPYAATKAVPRLISKGSSSVLASPRVDAGALNDGVGTLISVNDASTVDGTSIADADSSMTGKPFTNNMDCTGTVTYTLDGTGTVTTSDLCNRSLTGGINASTRRAAICQS